MKLIALEHGARRLVGENDVVEVDFAAGDLQVGRAGLVLHLLRLMQQAEHRVHVDQRLGDLAIDGAEEVQRLIQLDEDRVRHDQVADRDSARA